jgi:hypothetical protein
MNSLKREATRGVIIVTVETVEQLFGWAKWGNSFVGKYVYIYIHFSSGSAHAPDSIGFPRGNRACL